MVIVKTQNASAPRVTLVRIDAQPVPAEIDGALDQPPDTQVDVGRGGRDVMAVAEVGDGEDRDEGAIDARG